MADCEELRLTNYRCCRRRIEEDEVGKDPFFGTNALVGIYTV